jgi:hypothetical protein
MNQSSPTPNSPNNLEAGFVPVETPTPKPTPTASLELDELFDSPTPTPTPTSEESKAVVNGNETPTPTPKASPRIEQVVSAHDTLMIGYRRHEDSRRYRFQLDNIARIKGTFSARGGGVTVRILSGTTPVYVSGFNVSADSIDAPLYPGVYELEVTLVGTETALVSFSVDATAYYNPQ